MTRSEIVPEDGSGSDRRSLPLLVVLALGIVFQGGDWPPATFLIRTALFLLAALFLLRFDVITLRLTAVDLLVASFLAVEAASLVRAEYRWVSYQWFLHHSAAFVLYLLVRAHPDRLDRLPAAAGLLVIAAAALEVVVAFYQRFVSGAARPAGTVVNPNILAEILLYGIIAACCVHEALAGRGSAGRRWLAPLIVLFAAGILLAGSRGGLLASLAAAAFLSARRFGWKRAMAGTAIAAAAIAAGLVLPASSTLLDRFLGRGDPYAFERLNMWKAALRIFADHPFGVGTGHFQFYWPAARSPVEGSLVRFARHAATPHSEFFSVLSDLGVPGAAAFLGLGAAGIVSLRRAARAADPAAAGAATILLASFLTALVQTNYHIIGLLLVNAAALAIVSGRLWEPVWTREIQVKGILRPAAVTLLGAMAAYAGLTLAGTLLAAGGQRALEGGRLRDAERRFVQASAADPWQAAFPDSLSAVRYRLHESGSGDDSLALAIESEMEATIRNPLDFRYPARLGFLYLEAMDRFPGSGKGMLLAASLAAYDKAIMLNPHSSEIRYQKAVVLRAAGRREESRRLIENVLSDEPRYARGWVFLGEVLEREDRGRAIAAYEKAAKLYYTYGTSVSDPDEMEFVKLDVKAVERRIRELRAGAGG